MPNDLMADNRIAAFAIEQAPSQCLCSLSPDGSLVFGTIGTANQKGNTYLMPANHPRQRQVVRALGELLEMHSIVALPESSPEQAFTDAAREEPSVHIAVQETSGRLWRSCFTEAEVPENVAAFLADVRELEPVFQPGPHDQVEAIPDWLAFTIGASLLFVIALAIVLIVIRFVTS